MPFPYLPAKDQDEAFFAITDPFGLRTAIIPLFTTDDTANEIVGIGTAFRVDPFGTCLTAYHVLESRETRNFYNEAQLGKVFGMFSLGLVFGQPPIPRDCFVSVREAATFRAERKSPLMHKPAEAANIFDCAKLIFDPQNPRVQKHRDFLPLQVYGGMAPEVGERVMAIGYPGVMNVRHVPESNVVHFTEGLYGAIGIITEILPRGRNSTRPWPTFVVSSKWPSGISGGPIFNEAGNVIGIVSSSLHNANVDELTEGYSFWFRPLYEMQLFLPGINLHNAGWLRVWAVREKSSQEIFDIFPEKGQAESIKERLGSEFEIIFISNKFGTDDYVIENRIR